MWGPQNGWLIMEHYNGWFGSWSLVGGLEHEIYFSILKLGFWSSQLVREYFFQIRGSPTSVMFHDRRPFWVSHIILDVYIVYKLVWFWNIIYICIISRLVSISIPYDSLSIFISYPDIDPAMSWGLEDEWIVSGDPLKISMASRDRISLFQKDNIDIFQYQGG